MKSIPHTLRRGSAFLAALFVVCLAGLSGVLEGCGRRPSGTAEAPESIVVAYTVDIQGVNELIAESTLIMNALVYYGLFTQLVEEQPDYQNGPPSFLPRLAESYDFSEDRLTLTFHLRDGVLWSDGVPVTAEDVRWTWQAQTDPDVGWDYSESKAYIKDVEVVDNLTVRFHFTEPYATQLQDANSGVVLPKHAWSRLPFKEWRGNGDWFVENLVVNGPFTLESWQPQQRYVLKRNERHFEEGFPKTDRIVFDVIPDTSARLGLLRSGKAHLIEYVDPIDAAMIEADPNLYLMSHISRSFFFIQWNVTRPLFATKEVRQALSMAIDRQEIVDTLHFGYSSVSHSPFPSNIWVHNKNIEPWPYDRQRALELLASQGWTDTDGDGILDRDGKPFSFELTTNSESQVRVDLLVLVQEQLKEIGIDVRTRTMEFNALLVPLNQHDFDAVFQALAIDTNLNTSYFFHSQSIDNGFNWGSYSNPELDRLIDETVNQIDQLAVKPLYDQLQVMLHEEVPMTFIYESQRLSGASKRLRDVDPNALNSFFHLRRWRLEDE